MSIATTICIPPLLLCICIAMASAQGTVLRHYTPLGNPQFVRVGDLFAERFRADGPLLVRSVTVRLANSQVGGEQQFLLRILGGNAGDLVPEDAVDLINPILKSAVVLGSPLVTIDLPTPAYVDDEQFYVAIEPFNGGNVRPLLIGDGYPAICVIDTGDHYYVTVWRSRGEWGMLAQPAWFDVTVDYIPQPSPSFVDATVASGLPDDMYARSIAWGDANRDASPDLLVAGRLFIGDANGVFTDVTADAGITTTATNGTFIDIDRDGDDDILVIANDNATVFRNDGALAFTPVPMRLPPLPYVSSVCVADYDADGDPDVFIGQSGKLPGMPGGEFVLLANDGAFKFTDVTALLGSGACAQGDVRGAMWIDVDDDHDPDLMVADNINGNRLWRNDRVDGRSMFTEVVTDNASRAAITGRTNGFDWGDFDNDGTLDPLLARFGGDTTSISRNAVADDSSFARFDASGIRREGLPSGAAMGDFDNDGKLDFIVGAGAECRYAELYRQKTEGGFAVETFQAGLAHRSIGPDATWIDIDNDGRLDLATIEDGIFRVYRNVAPAVGNHVAFDLIPLTPGVESARIVVTAGGRAHMREVHAGRGLLMQDPTRMHVGIGSATTVDDVVVWWPSGAPSRERFTIASINRTHALQQGTGTALP